MEDLCSACLCAGRKLYFINETGFENLYSQIIDELPVYNMMELCVRICWECKALLRRLGDFKEQVKRSYTELTSFVQQNSAKPFISPRLQIQHVHSDSYPQLIKEESDLSPQDDEPVHHEDDDYDVKSEGTHCEPETFVKDLCIDMKVKKIKKRLKPIKEKSKRKLKIKNEIKTKSHVKQRTSRTVEDIIDSTVNDCYKQQEIKEDLEEKKLEKMEVEVQVRKSVDKTKPEVKGTFPEKPVCGECGKTFSSRKTYRYHLNVLHKGQNRYPCPRCGKVYQWKSNLGRHMRSHKARDSDELYCETCDKRFASVATYRQHLRISRRHVSESEFSFMCTECGKKFVNKTRLRDHIDWEHLKKIKFKCQLCNKPFKCHTSLYVHVQNVHRSKDKKDNLCHVCGKSYQNPAKLKYHIVAMHTSETPYQCQQCNAAFGWYSSLYRHVREVHYKMKLQPKKSKKMKKPEILPSLLPVIPQQLIPQMHQPGPA